MPGGTNGRCVSASNLLSLPLSFDLIASRTKIYSTSDGTVDARYCNILCLNKLECKGFNYK